MKEEKTLYVVPEFDTEGPSFGRDDLYGDWPSLLDSIKKLSGTVRNELPDSLGHPMIFNWFLLDWVGYSDEDLMFRNRKQATGFHHVFDMYRKELLSDKALVESCDGLYWHYHHPLSNGSWGWNRNWDDSLWYEKVLNKKILERNFFPSVFRAGGYVENNDTSNWLEKWIPFDYSNNSPAFKEDAYNWVNAPQDWIPYHPNINDYQKKGAMNRFIARSIPVMAKGGSNKLTKEEVVKAFSSAENGEKPILSFCTHDYYKSAAEECKIAHSFILEVSKDYPNVVWKYANAHDALRQSLSISHLPSLKIEVTKKNPGEFIISTNHGIFGQMPYVVIQQNGHEERIDVESINTLSWKLVIDVEKVTKVGIAANDCYGGTAVKVINL